VPDDRTENQQTPHIVDPYARSTDTFLEPPRGIMATLGHLGPGMILVGSIVGSGELIMTTKLGAEAGFVLLWFVLLSCFIKVVVQGELVRHTISSGRTFLDVFNTLPGPRGRRPVWLNLEWMAVVVVVCVIGLATYTQLRPASGSAAPSPEGQEAVSAEAVENPSTESQISSAQPEQTGTGLWLNLGLLVFVVSTSAAWAGWILLRTNRRIASGQTDGDEGATELPQLNWFMWLWLVTILILFVNGGAILGGAGQAVELAFPNLFGEGGSIYWTIMVAVLCAALLLTGGYAMLERISVGLVATFTLITIICTCLLQGTDYAITPAQVAEGLQFNLPTALTAGMILTALGMYAGTGIGSSEMMTYTYWCVEKGYARNCGAPLPGQEWPRRARGWVRVMYTDVFLTMVVYTVSTIGFYFLGAAVLHAQGKNPDGLATLRVLQQVYVETLSGWGNWAATLFVVGGFFILFSTVLSGVAGGTRILADGLSVMGIIDPRDYPARVRFTRIFVVVALVLYTLTYAFFENPPVMLMIASMVSVAIYPVLGLGTLYLRYREVDSRIRPGPVTTLWLWVCGLALAIISPTAALFALALDRGWITLSGG